MALSERDPYTGKLTTGHEWNGIRELDSPVPRAVLFFLATFVAFAIVWTVLMPAWPSLTGYTRGVLGIDQQREVEQSLAEAAAERANWVARIESADLSAIAADPDLMDIARERGATLFGDNCAACHGTGARGGPGFPNLASAPTLWGDTPDLLLETIRVGINSAHPQTRFAQMPAFGRDGTLDAAAIRAVTSYVRSLSRPSIADPGGAGAEVFASLCSGCHGADATGLPGTGAPNLADGFWTYGGTQDAVFRSIFAGRQGHMPHWEGRLAPVDLRMLALYLADLRSADR